MALRHEELTREIIGGVMEVHNDIGVGLDEETYHKALFDLLRQKAISVVSKERKQLLHRGVQIREFELDLLVYDIYCARS